MARTWHRENLGVVKCVAIRVFCLAASELAKDKGKTIQWLTVVAAASARLLVIHVC